MDIIWQLQGLPCGKNLLWPDYVKQMILGNIRKYSLFLHLDVILRIQGVQPIAHSIPDNVQKRKYCEMALYIKSFILYTTDKIVPVTVTLFLLMDTISFWNFPVLYTYLRMYYIYIYIYIYFTVENIQIWWGILQV